MQQYDRMIKHLSYLTAKCSQNYFVVNSSISDISISFKRLNVHFVQGLRFKIQMSDIQRTVNPSGAPEFTPIFSGVRGSQSSVICVWIWQIIACPLALLLWAIVLSVLRITPLVSAYFFFLRKRTRYNCTDYISPLIQQISLTLEVIYTNQTDRSLLRWQMTSFNT